MDSQQARPMSQASIYDTFRVLRTVVAPTLAKGVIKRRPWIEAMAQHLGLDTDAVQLLQELRKKYGSGPLTLWLPFRTQVVLLDSKDVANVLNGTPIPYGSATKEKKSSLAHFEPNHILVAEPERRAQLRPVHEQALATSERVHPSADHFQRVINEEIGFLFPSADNETTLDWPTFSAGWFRIVRRVILGDAARSDDEVTNLLDDIRYRANWGFMAPANDTKLDAVQSQLSKYIQSAEPNSLVSRLPRDPSSKSPDLESQITHWLFAFDAVGIATFRALALLASHPDAQSKVAGEASINSKSAARPYARAVFLESVRLWPTTPAILRELNEDATLGGQQLAKGTGVVIFAPFFHRDTEKLEFADALAPEQWLGKEGEVDMVRALVPFSAGPAICPAHRLVPMLAGLVMGEVVGKANVGLVAPDLESGKLLPGTLDHSSIQLRLERH
ncbi:cytochrome P450 [Parathielavia appendiculata]|uniref:Cytochrome P450 n=1 Tax=Parathielavia appendiculata TaxID=2587402 RepID=A0AAN6Z1D4_9PEZI|nr:cytochrome P450 [Parathielavia appendiculata]